MLVFQAAGGALLPRHLDSSSVPVPPWPCSALQHSFSTCVYVRAHADAHSPMHTRVPTTGELSDESRSAKSNTLLAKGSNPFLAEKNKYISILLFFSFLRLSDLFSYGMLYFPEISRCSQMYALM